MLNLFFSHCEPNVPGAIPAGILPGTCTKDVPTFNRSIPFRTGQDFAAADTMTNGYFAYIALCVRPTEAAARTSCPFAIGPFVRRKRRRVAYNI